MSLNLLGLNREQFQSWCAERGEKPFRARQMMRWMHQSGVSDFGLMSDVSRSFREQLAGCAVIAGPEVLRDTTAPDGTRKWLFNVGTGNAIEAVYIPEGDVDDEVPVEGVAPTGRRYRGTLCISSQAGCALECSFCSTGRQGFNRNLTTAEIIGQLWQANRLLGKTSREERIVSNVVMMGMGEPLANYDNVVTAMQIMLDDSAYGLSRRRVTLSTSGLVPAMDRLKEDCPVALVVSLHAPNDALRDVIVPINKKYPLKELMAACNRYLEKAPRDFVTFEYVMLDGVNDTVEHAHQLLELVKNVPCKFNLIPFNPFPGSPYRRSPRDRISAFASILIGAGFVTTTRKTRGDDIDAACGQLKTSSEKKSRAELDRVAEEKQAALG